MQATGRNGISPSFCVSRKKSNRCVSSAAERRREVLQALGRFYLLASTQPGMSGTDAAPNSLWGPLPWGKGGKKEKMDCPDGENVGGGHQGGRGAAEEGNAAEKLGLRRFLCSSTGQWWSWGFRHQKLSRPAAGLWDGLLVLRPALGKVFQVWGVGDRSPAFYYLSICSLLGPCLCRLKASFW